MTDREKMIELLLGVPKPQEYAVARRNGKGLITAGMIADHLIANGVTLQTLIMTVAKKRANRKQRIFSIGYKA